MRATRTRKKMKEIAPMHPIRYLTEDWRFHATLGGYFMVFLIKVATECPIIPL